VLNITLQFLKDELNTYLQARTGTITDVIKVCSIVDETGKYAFDKDLIGASIINIEEERILRSHLNQYELVNNQHVVLKPELKLNLYILFAANFKLYEVALKYLSHLLTFFQSHPMFTPTEYPALDQRIEKLIMELQSPSFEQLNQIWAFIGGKQLPSVLYKLRMVALQETAQSAIQPPLTIIRGDLRNR
jgi:hypothetical protein